MFRGSSSHFRFDHFYTQFFCSALSQPGHCNWQLLHHKCGLNNHSNLACTVVIFRTQSPIVRHPHLDQVEAMAAGKSTRASAKVTASSKASNGSEAAEVRASSKLKLQPADPTNCKISDNMADCCKTLCKVCRLCSIRNMTFSNARCAETLSVWLT